MICVITDPKIVDKLVLPLLLKMPGLTYEPRGYLKYIKDALETEHVLLLVNLNDDNEVTAVSFTETVISITDLEAMIDLTYTIPEDTTSTMEMWGMIKMWASSKGCKWIRCITDQLKARAMIRKYGFSQKWAYLSYKIEGKEEGKNP
jgi:hypothetical protein